MDVRRGIAACLLAAVLAACSTAPPSGTSDGPTVSPPPPSASAPAASDAPTGAPASFAADRDRLLADLEALQAAADVNGGMRATGTPGYDASVEHVAAELDEIGFSVDRPAVSFTGFRELSGTRLEVDGTVVEGTDELRALIYSAGGDVSGPVAVLTASGCDPSDFEDVQPGSIALTTMGGCFRRDQAINAAAAGVAALIVGYPGRGPGEIYRPTLIDPDQIEIPAVSVTDATVGLLEDAREVRLVVATDRSPSSFENVVAQLGDGPAVIMLGAHLDSVLDGPGINDDGSGVASLLEVARGLAAAGVPDGWAVRIGLWGAEEFGAIGSRAYAETVGDEVAAYLNLDMTGSVNGANFVYAEAGAAPGSDAITEAYEAWFAANGLESDRIDIGGASDHSGFVQAGIPTGGLFAGASETGSAASPGAGGDGAARDPCYHLACDTVANVDLERVAMFTEATLGVTIALMASAP